MVSHPTGLPKERELVIIETAKLTCVIKGIAAHPQYNKLRRHMSFKVEDAMQFQCRADDLEVLKVYNALSDSVEPYQEQPLLPIFFENGRYEVIIIPKKEGEITFYHEFPSFREAVQRVSRSNFLTGILHFRNEVGLTSFEILGEKKRVLLTVILEVYPTKLDYKKDYKALLDEVNEEIYNLAYHFIKRTYLQGSAKIYKEPSLSEFYRLIDQHFQQYQKAIQRIERNAHHQLKKTYVEVRGDRLRRQDAKTLAYLRRNVGKFVDVEHGIPIHGRTVMPFKGLLIQKESSVDTHENRYVKWTMTRIVTRLKDLKRVIKKAYFRGYGQLDEVLLNKVTEMIEWVEKRKRNLFWHTIGQLDRSLVSLVLQMAPGYRNVLQIYTTISKSIILHGEIYNMSVKDIATLYEYWTFLKLGRILDDKCIPVSQDVVQVNNHGLFVRLDQSRTAERKYKHPVTEEEVILKYQFDTTPNRVPTVQQKPDTMLSIGKKGKDYQYQYIFDAKYRLDLETNPTSPGPMQDDINTMHRYRDSIVVNTDGRYERTAFGAYVLFPWYDEIAYQKHPLYESIDSVNIGGFPFLPNSIDLVDQFIDNLLNKSPEELQEEGILPKGAYEEVNISYAIHKVLIHPIDLENDLHQFLANKYYKIATEKLPKNWELVRYVALYEDDLNCIQHYAKVTSFEIVEDYVQFEITKWQKRMIQGNMHRIEQLLTINEHSFLQASYLADMYIKNREETILYRMIQRISNDIIVELDHVFVEKARRITAFVFGKYKLTLRNTQRELIFTGPDFIEPINMDLILDNESYIFKRMTELVYPL